LPGGCRYVSARWPANIPAEQLVAYVGYRVRRFAQAHLAHSMAFRQATDFSRFWVW